MKELTANEIRMVTGAGLWGAINTVGTFLGNMSTFSEFGYGLGVGLYDATH